MRQNVILDIGFIIASPGWERVSTLVKGEFATPSDYDGIVHARPDDEGGWQMKLVQEPRTAGFGVDACWALQR